MKVVKILLMILLLGLSISVIFEKTYKIVTYAEYKDRRDQLVSIYLNDDNYETILDKYDAKFHQVASDNVLLYEETRNYKEGILYTSAALLFSLFLIEDMKEKERVSRERLQRFGRKSKYAMKPQPPKNPDVL